MIFWSWKRSDDTGFMWRSWRNEARRYCSRWDTRWVGEFSDWLLLNISATLRWIGSVNPNIWMVWKTNGEMTGERNNPTRLNHGDGVKVSCSRATCYHKFLQVFFPFSPVISDQYLFIFFKLEEDNICLFYNFPFGQTCHYVLTSLAIVKLILV